MNCAIFPSQTKRIFPITGCTRLLISLLLCVIQSLVFAADPNPIDQLASPDIAIRRTAIDAIQTQDDPRIPEACLPLLSGEGFSIRRQAARAIGSRFDHIPPARIPVFLAALQKCADDGPDDVTLVAKRAIGLLKRDYASDSFLKSPDGKWVLYERRRLPVVANIATQKHQLLSPVLPLALNEHKSGQETFIQDGEIQDSTSESESGLLKLMVTNESAADLFRATWQPQSKALAFTLRLEARFFNPVCLWRQSDEAVTVWDVKSFASLYGNRFPHWGTVAEFVKWDGNKAVIHIYDCVDGGGGSKYDPQGILVSVNIRNWKTALVGQSAK